MISLSSVVIVPFLVLKTLLRAAISLRRTKFSFILFLNGVFSPWRQRDFEFVLLRSSGIAFAVWSGSLPLVLLSRRTHTCKKNPDFTRRSPFLWSGFRGLSPVPPLRKCLRRRPTPSPSPFHRHYPSPRRYEVVIVFLLTWGFWRFPPPNQLSRYRAGVSPRRQPFFPLNCSFLFFFSLAPSGPLGDALSGGSLFPGRAVFPLFFLARLLAQTPAPFFFFFCGFFFFSSPEKTAPLPFFPKRISAAPVILLFVASLSDDAALLTFLSVRTKAISRVLKARLFASHRGTLSVFSPPLSFLIASACASPSPPPVLLSGVQHS